MEYTIFSSGNKKDLEAKREVNFTDAKQFAHHNNMIGVIESSAKENINIDETFIKLAKVWIVVYFVYIFTMIR